MTPASDARRVGPVRRLLRRFGASDAELAGEDRQREAVASGCTLLATAQDRERVALTGHLSSVTVNPAGRGRWLVAELDDGSGTVSLVWMGRRMIRGIDAGRRLRVEGRLSYVDGRRTIYNPRYELLP